MEKRTTECGDLSVRHYVSSIVISFLILLPVALFAPLYYETGNDVFSKLISSGTFTGIPEGVISSYGSAVLLSDFYALLYKQYPLVPWFDFFNLLYLSVASVHVWILLKPYMINAPIGFKLLALTISLLFIQNILFSEPTRTGILLSGTSLIILYTRQKTSNTTKIFLLFFSIIGFLIRIEAGILAFALIHTIGFLYTERRNSFLYNNIILYILIGLLLIFINIPRNDAEKNYLTIRPYQFSLWDFFPEHNNLRLYSYADSVKLNTSKQFFLADEQALNFEFFERIGIVAVDKTPAYLPNYIKSLNSHKLKFEKYLKQYFSTYLTFILIWVSVFIAFTYRSKYKVKLAAIFFMCVGTLAAITFFMKMEDRLFFSLICLNILTIVAFNDDVIQKIKAASWFTLLCLMLLLFSGQLIYKLSSSFYSQKKIAQKELTGIKNQLKYIPDSSIVLLNLVPLVHWDSRYFERTNNINNIRFIPYDNGLMYIQKGNKQYLDNEFGCNDFECISKMAINYKNTFFISDSTRLSMMKLYLSSVYDIEFNEQIIHTHPRYRSVINQSFELYRVLPKSND